MKKQRKISILDFEVVFEPDHEDGGYIVTVPKLPGLVTQGETITEARAMAKDAIRCYLEGILKGAATGPKGRRSAARRETYALTL